MHGQRGQETDGGVGSGRQEAGPHAGGHRGRKVKGGAGQGVPRIVSRIVPVAVSRAAGGIARKSAWPAQGERAERPQHRAASEDIERGGGAGKGGREGGRGWGSGGMQEMVGGLAVLGVLHIALPTLLHSGEVYDSLVLADDSDIFAELKVKEIKNGCLAISMFSYYLQAIATGEGFVENSASHIADSFFCPA